MKRRTVLASTVAAISVGSLSGCLGGEGDTGDGGGSGGNGGTAETTSSTANHTSSATRTSSGTTGASSTTDGETTTGGTTTDGTTTSTNETTTVDQTGKSSITSTDFESTGECSNPESATVKSSSDGSSSVTVTGCIRGPNGCAKPKLESATLDGDTLRVVVTTKEERDNGTACTEVIVHLGYRVTIELSGSRPKQVEVVHDTMGEKKTVATKN